MSSENINNDENDFKDFADVPDNLDLDVDFSTMSDDDVEKALQNIVSQMSETQEHDIDKTVSDASFEAVEENEITSEPESEQNKSEENTTEINNQEEDNPSSDAGEIEEIKNETEEKSKDEKIAEITPETDDNNSLEEDKKEDTLPDNNTELSQWEELDDSDDVVKKYIVYISKDFVPYIDRLSVDERSAYINDAIQQKLDMQDEEKQALIRKNAIIHFVIAAIIIIAVTPLGLLLANKAIMATFENYKYSQDNFEKLYKHRFEHDKAYMRSIQYNKEYEQKLKDANH